MSSTAEQAFNRMCDLCRLHTQISATRIAKEKIVNPRKIYEIINDGLCEKCKHFLKGR